MSIPKVFISYSWDGPEHKAWVRTLAAQLRNDGVDVTLDQWHVRPGDPIAAFMDKAVRENDFVLIICTPKYKVKSDERNGGVSYEGDIIQSEVFLKGNHSKFIPVLRSGQWPDAAPANLLSTCYIDLTDGPGFQENYDSLLRNLHGEWDRAPKLGHKPVFSSNPNTETTASNAALSSSKDPTDHEIASFASAHQTGAKNVRPLSMRFSSKKLIKVLIIACIAIGTIWGGWHFLAQNSSTKQSALPSGATAQCIDRTYSFSQHRTGTCSQHGGVKTWLAQ
ncbi:MAG TPA: TIR domain-containing protein [Candidatus Angelobacter sp.]|jgi:hypothetical protein|nr:TIR domain-containing protein [Candidatus Angelobacter sp.]